MLDTPRSLIQRLATDSHEADWRRMVLLYQPFIAYWLRKTGVGEHDAEDLSQEILTVVHQEMPKFQHSQITGAFRKWLKNVVCNRCRGFFRSRQLRSLVQPDSAILDQLEDPSSGLSGDWNREHDAFLTRQLFNSLEGEFTPMTWAAFRRQVVDGAKAVVVAGELGMTVNAVLVAKSRVLRRFREEAAGLVDD